MRLVLQVYFRDHTGSLDNPNMDTQSELMKYHSDFLNWINLPDLFTYW
jgi:hypothetical protein